MFEQLRYNLKHNRKSVMKAATAWFLFGMIILVFAFWGMAPDQGALGGAGTAASVNGKGISVAKFVNALDRMQNDPQNARPDAGRQMLEQQAISQLVEIELISQAADSQHIWTSDAEIRDLIMQIPAFQEEGKFKRERYMGYLAQVRQSPAEFEADLRSEMSLRRTSRLFASALRPITLESERTKELSTLKTNVEFVAVPTEKLISPQTVATTDVSAFLEKPENKSRVKEYFESHKSEFATPEQVKARHILIRADGTNPEADKKAMAKIEEIAEKAKQEDFAKLASQFSEDPGSKTNGGLLDFFGRGMMVPEFEDVAFSAEPKAISKPIKTQFGYHLIQVEEKRAARDPKVEDVENEIAQILLAQERSQKAIAELAAILKAGDQPGLAKFMNQYSLKWDETGVFSIDSQFVPKVGPNDELMRTAFELNSEKPMAKDLVRDGSRAFVVRHKPVPADAKSTPAAGSEIMAEMMAGRRSQDAFGTWVKDLRNQATITVNSAVVANQ